MGRRGVQTHVWISIKPSKQIDGRRQHEMKDVIEEVKDHKVNRIWRRQAGRQRQVLEGKEELSQPSQFRLETAMVVKRLGSGNGSRTGMEMISQDSVCKIN